MIFTCILTSINSWAFGMCVQMHCLLAQGDSVADIVDIISFCSYPTSQIFALSETSESAHRALRLHFLHRDRLNRVIVCLLFEVEKFQASADVRVRVREPVIRVRIRKAALSAIIRITAHIQQLHGLLPLRTAVVGPLFFTLIGRRSP